MGLLARSLLPVARGMLKELGLEPYDHRLVSIELGIRAREVLADPAQKGTEIESLVADAVSHCKTVSETNDEIAPSASVLAQVIYACIFLKVPVPSTAYETLESALTKVGEPAASLIRTTSVPAPPAAEVLALTQRTEAARYPEDTGFDLRPVVIAARRLLDSEEASRDARVAAFAVELLTDQAMGTSMAEAGLERPIKSVPDSIEEPARFAEEISKTGINVSLLGMGESGRLARITLNGSDLVIVAAHGGIVPEGRFFQVVTDDADLRVSSSALSGALRNVRVVVLFVCSAGRFDEHPMASTTVGLAKELLDGGCSVVVASPWPLDSRVPSHWLPAFLKAWNGGSTAIDANFDSNKAVETAMGNCAAYCLAMTIFGDPFVVRKPN